MPGLQTTPPDVQTAPFPTRAAMSRIPSASFAAPASASRRSSIGVEPACAAWPVHVTRQRSTPNVPRTTPSGRPSLEHRALLDVQLQVRGRVLELRSCVERPVEVDAVGAERVGQRDAVPVGQQPQLVLVAHRAAGRRRAEQRAAEARPFLVGPVDEPDGDRRRALLGDPPQHLRAGDDVEAPVEPAAVRDRVDVAADQDGALRVAAQRPPVVAGRVALDARAAGPREPVEPRARRVPRLGPRDPLGPVLVTGELLQLAQSARRRGQGRGPWRRA